ncbi:hypothetical protein BHE74_00021851 [Ensete ventricosum]|nr:hypothetical protein BHE74_00021851 [Ensete ventricosum]
MGGTYRSVRLSVRGPPATGRFRQKSTVGGRLKKKSTVGGRLRKKKGRRRGKEEKKKRRISRLHAILARGSPAAAVAFSPARGERSRRLASGSRCFLCSKLSPFAVCRSSLRRSRISRIGSPVSHG